jgi:hypothetical protein
MMALTNLGELKHGIAAVHHSQEQSLVASPHAHEVLFYMSMEAGGPALIRLFFFADFALGSFD